MHANLLLIHYSIICWQEIVFGSFEGIILEGIILYPETLSPELNGEHEELSLLAEIGLFHSSHFPRSRRASTGVINDNQ